MHCFIFSEISLDGKLTISKGVSSKVLFDLLSEDDFKFIHKYREQVDGIMVGKNTVNIDNPSLTNRYGNKKSPTRIIPSNSLNFNFGSTIFNDSNETIIVTNEGMKNTANAELIEKKFNKKILYFGKHSVNFRELFHYLEIDLGYKSIMVEGGSTLNWELIKEGLISEVLLLQLPIIIGGNNTPSLFGGEGYKSMVNVPIFTLAETQRFGEVLFIRYVNTIR